jgi:glycosyltransferase involved in cell wall biosynthesis
LAIGQISAIINHEFFLIPVLSRKQKNKMAITVLTSKPFTSFVKLELKWLSKFDGHARIVTADDSEEIDNYQNIYGLRKEFSGLEFRRHLLKRGITLFLIFARDLFSKGGSMAYVKQWRSHLSVLIKSSLQADLLHADGFFRESGPYYSYFMNDFALVLAISVRRGYIDCFFGRGHGRDVIEGREPKTAKLPFQWFKYKYAEKVFAVSEPTRNYIQSKYPQIKEKVEVAYLGTEGRPYKEPEFPEDEFVVVSVGRIRNVKRYFLIAEMLQHADLKIRWVHFGDISPQDPTTPRFKSSLEELTKKTNVEVELRGTVANEEILDYYEGNAVDLLLSTSEDEGLPVSMMEAISFGIPVFATDVGGNSDIVNEKTGVLIEKNFDPEIACVVMQQMLVDKTRDLNFRKGIRDFWEGKFEVETNYHEFLNQILKS